MRRQRGWVLLMVLLVLLLLSVGVSAFFNQAQEANINSVLMTGQQQALIRADRGMQDGVRALRGRQINVQALGGFCTVAVIETIPADVPAGFHAPPVYPCYFYASPRYDGGDANGLDQNGGMQYQFLVYQLPPGAPNWVKNRYVVRSTGFYGYNLNSTNLITSTVEAEVDVGLIYKDTVTTTGY